MFELKTYQKQALEALENFLVDAQTGVSDAFSRVSNVPYRHYGFGEIPYICLRLPTGGGKTVLASHTVSIVKRAYLEQPYPFVLWLVPTNAIREQTLQALKTVGHPYRQQLEADFGLLHLRVLDIGDVTQINAHDIGNKVIIVVATLATLRVEDTSGRKVYAYHEDFEPHFANVSPNHPNLERVTENDLRENGLTKNDIGKIKMSFANLLAVNQPLIIMDEAHNARTSLTFDTLKRLHPACIVEFTATPDTSATSASNVLYHCSAAELKAEHMIKLPILLTEHTDWQTAVRDAVLTGKKLNQDAQKSGEKIRPIVLFQAESKGGAVTVEVLRTHLIENLHIAAAEIAIATGEQRELAGVDLFASNCSINYIITKEALKEGWDCSFAYVFCSVKDVRSSKDAEQLLGRVLRMPFAKRRSVESLNCAYAHLASPSFSQVAKCLTDSLINMGFEEIEAVTSIQLVNQNDVFNETLPIAKPIILTIELPKAPDLTDLENSEEIAITTTETDNVTVEITGMVSDSTSERLLKTVTGTQKKALKIAIEQHNVRVQAYQSPSMRGEVFKPLPQLCYRQNDLLELIDVETFLYDVGDWSLQNFPAVLPQFELKQTSDAFEVDIDGKKVFYRVAGQQLSSNLDWVKADFTEHDLIHWLDREVQQVDLNQSNLRAFLSRLIGHLIAERGLPLTGLIRSQFALARNIKEQISNYRQQAAKQGFQTVLFEQTLPLETSFEYSYSFGKDYPARPPFYEGAFKFDKHFYPVIEDLKASGEEFECAQAIERHPKIKRWIRNLVKRGAASFRLPLDKGYFYPDFVTELTDGRLLVIEYKGEIYKTNDDSREKNLVGNTWAKHSDGSCLFLMVVKKDDDGRNVYQQIDNTIRK